MPIADLAKALCVMLIWGGSFTVIKVGLFDVPPMLMGALRFVLAAFPALLFVRKPRVAFKWWLAYGMTVGVGQFALLLLAIRLGMPAGIASVALQSQAFFTLIFAALLVGESWHWPQFIGLAIAAAGLDFLAGNGSNAVTFVQFALTLGAAAFWGLSNIIARMAADRTQPPAQFDLLGFLVWTSLIPPLPFAALSLWFDGPQLIATTLSQLSWKSVGAIAYLAFGGTLIGNGLFTALLTRYPSGRVAPFTLLVPLFGLATASFVLGERLAPGQWLGCALVILGLITNTAGGNVISALRTTGR